MAVKAVVEPELKKKEGLSENVLVEQPLAKEISDEPKAHFTSGQNMDVVGHKDDENSEENYESEIQDDDLDFEDISDIESTSVSDREDDDLELDQGESYSPLQTMHETTTMKSGVRHRKGGMIDKINAIENDLKKFQEKLSQYDQDINSLQIVAGATRGLDGFGTSNAESDSDSGTRWIDTGHGLLPFIQSCLQDTRYGHVVKWTVVNKEFEILDLAKLAEMWGREKKKEGMTKRKLNRSLSYLIKTKNKLIKSPNNKSVYTIVSNKAGSQRNRSEQNLQTAARRDSTSSHDSNTSFDVKPTMNARDMKALLEKATVFNGRSREFESITKNTVERPSRKRAAQSTPVSPMLSRGISKLPTMNDSKMSPNSDLFCLSRDSKEQKLSCGIFQRKISSYNRKETSRQSSFTLNSGDLFAWSQSSEQSLQNIKNCTSVSPFLLSNSLYSNAEKNSLSHHDNALVTNGMITTPGMQFQTTLLDQVATSYKPLSQESGNTLLFPTNGGFKLRECNNMTQWNGSLRTDICGLFNNTHQSNGTDLSSQPSQRCLTFQDLSSIVPGVFPMVDSTPKFNDDVRAADNLFALSSGLRGTAVERDMADDVDDAVLDKYLGEFQIQN